jgi:glucose/arabinose dehydrogenase
MRKSLSRSLLLSTILLCAISISNAKDEPKKLNANVPESAGLKLPAGFTAIKAADNLGRVRHIAVTKQGDIYAKLERLKEGKGILHLQDTNNDGVVDKQSGFGGFVGTGMFIKDNYLYASSNEEVFRYKLDDKGKVVDTDKPEKIVTGLLNRRQHESKSIALDNAGNIYVNIGAYSNVCQVKDRVKGSPGMKDCPILDSAGGIWQFKANKLNQTYGDGVRYATGLRNVVGLDWNSQVNELFVMQHGRDQLQEFAEIYDAKTATQLPAETMYMVKKGDDAGWPYVYYDQFQKKKILNPEYGGDGKKEGSAKAIDPVAAFPSHLAPNGLLFYTGSAFPEKYKGGAFIAFHGSWNRAPEPQAGYFVAFVPFKNGKPSGDWEVFADGFAGTETITSPGQAQHRPCGLAQGSDGSLYISDDVKGTLYKITFSRKLQ